MTRCGLLLLLFFTGAAQADKLAPSLLQLTEQAQNHNRFDVVWKTPTAVASGQKLRPLIPEQCKAITQPATAVEGSALVSTWQIGCDESLLGKVIAVDGQQSMATVVKLVWADGNVVQKLITAQSPRMTVPERPGVQQIITSYTRYGITHILLGIDHLLFVLALVMLANSMRRLVLTITMFTVGHSITLSLAAVGIIHYPVALIEFAIAASIFILAVELGRPKRTSAENLLSRYSWLVAVSFGLLHGMGFAGALGELGLPVNDLVWALVSFNLGIEIGQVAFVVLSASIIALSLRYASPATSAGRWLTVYAIGSLSAYWCIDRAMTVVVGGIV